MTLKTGVMMLKIQLCITASFYNIFTHYYSIFDQINAALVRRRDFFKLFLQPIYLSISTSVIRNN